MPVVFWTDVYLAPSLPVMVLPQHLFAGYGGLWRVRYFLVVCITHLVPLIRLWTRFQYWRSLVYDFFAVVALCRFLVAIEFSIINTHYILLKTQKKGHGPFWTMSRKRQNLFSGNEKPRFWDIRSRQNPGIASPENGKTFFWKTRNPDFGTSCAPFWHHFLTWSQIGGQCIWNFRCIYGLVNMRSKKFRNLPSNARFFPKR